VNDTRAFAYDTEQCGDNTNAIVEDLKAYADDIKVSDEQ
jgi:hypothetical protein